MSCAVATTELQQPLSAVDPTQEDDVAMTTTTHESAMLADLARIIRQVAKVKPQLPIRAESRLIDDLAIDSLDLVAIVLQIQDEFDVPIDEDALPQLRRVSDLAAYVVRRESLATV
jgi:acyl carrier protein